MEEQLSKYFAGEASTSEIKKINSWRENNPENARQFIEFKEVWLASEKLSQPNEVVLEQIHSSKNAKVILWPSFIKYAAAILLIGLLGSIWYFDKGESDLQNVVFRGEATTLPDGSVVTLKDGASIESIDFTAEERSVKISGKAFFEVKRDESKPFLVVTDEATVMVLGTSFLVNKVSGFTEVCVESGLVAFSTNNPRKNNMSVNLKAGEMGVVGNNLQGIVKRKNDNQNFLAWKDGNLAFERTKSTEVVEILEDVYGKQFDLPDNLNDCRLTAKFNQKSFEEVIQIISATFNWKYEINKDKVVLSGEGC